MRIRVIHVGRGYDTAKAADEIELAAGATVSAALAMIREQTGGKMSMSTLVILSGRHLGTIASHDDARLNDGDEMMLLQPVAGG